MVLVTLVVLIVGTARTPGAVKSVIVPAQLLDVRGERVDVGALAADQRLFFVTLKATWCPVCQEQLRRLRVLLPQLRSCGAAFVVIAPGPRAALRAVADESGFPFPFVEDVDLALARSAGLRLADDQIEPAVFEVSASREIVWVERGRSAGRFNEEALLERLECDDLKTAAARRLR